MLTLKLVRTPINVYFTAFKRWSKKEGVGVHALKD